MSVSNLIFQTAYWGDLLLAVPLMKGVRRAFPQHSLALACRSGFGKFFLNQGLVDELFEVEKSDSASRSEFERRLGDRDFEWVFCPHMSYRSALWMRKVHAVNKVGFSTWWNKWAFQHRVPRPMNWPDGLRQLSLLRPADPALDHKLRALEQQDSAPILGTSGLQFQSSQYSVPEWASMSLVDPALEGSFKLPRSQIFIAPGSTWATKRWTPQGFGRVGQKLVEMGAEVWVVGTKKEYEICQTVQQQIPGAHNIAGQTSPDELFQKFLSGDLLITNDSGAMHMGSLANLPTVAIYGPTTLELGYRPWQNRAIVVERDLDCRPCGKHGHHKCPIQSHACMTEITSDDVLAAVNKLAPQLTRRSNS